MKDRLILKLSELFHIPQDEADTLLYALTIFSISAAAGIIHLICLNI